MIFLAPLYPAQPPFISWLMPCAHPLEFGTNRSLCLGCFLLSLIPWDAPSCCSDMTFSRNIPPSRQHSVPHLLLCLVLVYCNIRFTWVEVLHETKGAAVSILLAGRTEWHWESSDWVSSSHLLLMPIYLHLPTKNLPCLRFLMLQKD